MAIRLRFLASMACLWLILVPGAFASGTFGPDEPVRHALGLVDVTEPPILLIEQPWDAEIGSGPPIVEPPPVQASPVAVPSVQPPAASATAPVDEPAVAALDKAEVQFFFDRFTGSRRRVVDAWFQRSSRYLGMIRDVLRAHDLPEDLAFVAMIESGFNPLAVSRAGATGLWQFMAGTARRYGLRVDQWVDERFDPERSTRAAAAYLRDLYAMFGSWALAQAAYNAGEMTVARAIQAVQTTDFWTLAGTRFLRQETKDFVPQIVAATVIGREPSRYGFEPPVASRYPVDVVSVPESTSLAGLAKASGVPLDDLRALNPVLVRGVTPPGGRYDLRVPAGSRDGVLLALSRSTRVAVARAASPHVTRVAATEFRHADIHVVRPRETLSSIAKRYGVSVGDVVRWNRLGQQSAIRPGDRLRIAEHRAAAEVGGRPGAR